MAFTGSPTKKKFAASFNIFEDANVGENQVRLSDLRTVNGCSQLTQAQQHGLKRSSSMMPMPLTTSRLVNQIPTLSPKVRLRVTHDPRSVADNHTEAEIQPQPGRRFDGQAQ
jgi:hypothetical protein